MGASIAAFYRARGGAPLWFSPTSGASVQQLLLLLSTAQADGLNPNRFRVRNLSRAARAAASGNPAAVQRAEVMLSEAFVTYAQDQKRDPNVGIIYVDAEVRPAPPSASTLLAQLASAQSRAKYSAKGLDARFAQIAGAVRRQYGMSTTPPAPPSTSTAPARCRRHPRYVVVNPAAPRLYITRRRGGRLMRSSPQADPAFALRPLRARCPFAVLNPYWNAPPYITSAKLAPNVPQQFKLPKAKAIVCPTVRSSRFVSPASVAGQRVPSAPYSPPPLPYRRIRWPDEFCPYNQPLAARHAAEEFLGSGAASEQRLRRLEMLALRAPVCSPAVLPRAPSPTATGAPIRCRSTSPI